MGHKGHWGEYTGNAKWSKDHAHTKVTDSNYKASEKDDAAHIDYLKRDIKDDQKFHVKDKDEKQTADEKHISKLAGDMKYDKEHHGSPAKNVGVMAADAVRRARKTVNDISDYAAEPYGFETNPRFQDRLPGFAENTTAPGGMDYENMQARAHHADFRNLMGHDATLQKQYVDDMREYLEMPVPETGIKNTQFKK